MKNITRHEYKGRNFEIVLKDGYYLAIEDCYISNGKMNTSLNGIQMHAHKDLDDTIKDVNNWVDVKELEAEGVDTMVASLMVVAGMDRDAAEEMVRNMK